jgi:2-C-methyl-D-erythritol 4-phosphate cytidylyltransferase
MICAVTVTTIVVAAGGGRRFGAAKQFEPLGDATVVDRSVRTATAVSDAVVVAVPVGTAWTAPGVTIVTGGATRAASVRAALAVVPDSTDVVVVHDAARPLASVDAFRSVIAAVRAGADGAVPGVAIADTVKRVHAGAVVETVDRASLVVAQTPQAFRADVLREAHAHGGDATDDAALVEAAGGLVVVVPGESTNFKITEPGDLARAAACLEAGGDA